MPNQPWKILESSYMRPKFRIDKCELPNGKVFEPMVIEFGTWANVLAITKDQEAVLVKQYRHGVQEVLLEFPGGIVEEDEEPIDGIKRELLEETGYASNNIIEVGMVYPNPAFQTNRLFCFLAFDAEEVGFQNLDESEDIEVELVPLDELVAMTQKGKFLHGLQVATLFHALSHLKRIN